MRTRQQIINRLLLLCSEVPVLLNKISEEDFSHKPAPEKWSKKEILGHLIDSAANNHQRFVRIPFEKNPVIGYDQDNWNKYNHHQKLSTVHLIQFWTIYNQHLAEVIRYTTEEDLLKTGRSKEGREPVTLHWLADDYVVHLEHHLKAIGIIIN